MTTILLLTSESLPRDDVETALVAKALTAHGADARIIAWSNPDLGLAGAELAVIRSTWDYTTRLEEFLLTLERLPVPVLNPVPVVRWNAHKGYLAELAAAGVPVVPTVVVPAGSPPLLPQFDAAEVIIKPTVSAGARGVGRFPSDSAAAVEHLALLTSTADALVQPYLPAVLDGEISLIFLGGVYSHAVRKVPADGDFRVQERHGGAVHPHIASDREIEVAALALAAVPGGDQLLYARVDVVGTAANPMLMELELIEPELFLPLAPGAADRMAVDILARR